jgi:peptide/nickel transport system ATP-binding protein
LVPVDDLSFDMAPGEVLGLIGESGAGKSLAGAAIIGLLGPSIKIAGGEIWLQGRRIDGLPHSEMRKLRGARIGSVYQDSLTALDPLYTIGQQLVETIRTHSSVSAGEARERAIAYLDRVRIPAARQRFDSLPHELSGGMRQRVVIALALCAEPVLLVADEPTTALDVSTQAQIIDLLRSLCREQATAILLITHDMGVISEVAERVAVMYAGRLVEIGPVGDVIMDPKHPYTRGLMAAIPQITFRQDRLVMIDGAMPRLAQMPSGCAFHPRCPVREARCTSRRPPVVAAARGVVACWLASDDVSEPSAPANA